MFNVAIGEMDVTLIIDQFDAGNQKNLPYPFPKRVLNFPL